ncbi:MAG: exodeoxyribonuclease V subunit beta [Niastella sp.]|nr:exodeoxyribonuclease V subunit beta [Niastella sp.]
MNGAKQYIDFNASTAPLRDSNLIEASAGTGKTYSIAILVLRLVLEEVVPVKEILMVTFTKAAVAELEERVRLFIRSAHKYAGGHTIDDKNISALVQQAIDTRGEEAIQQQLRDSVLFLDETSVLTIHSFCQQTLNEFAFETFQLFGAEMQPDLTPVIEEELNKFWRKHVTTLLPRLLQQVWHEELRSNILEVLKNQLSGKKYPGFQEGTRYSITRAQQDAWDQQLSALHEKKLALEQELLAYVAANAAKLQAICEDDRNAKKTFLPCVASPKDFIAMVREKRSKAAYVARLFPEIIQRMDAIDAVEASIVPVIQAVYQQLCYVAIQEAGEGIALFKERNNVLGYDDLISNLHHALTNRNSAQLVKLLRKKYRAVFIDEFQDTDRQQFEIFDTAFGEDTTLFYIGDPKQSIYAWRKADIFTYFKARDAVKHVYSMNHNYRSSERMIHAMNTFFLPEPGFDTFYFKEADNAILYMPVESPVPNAKGELLRGKAIVPAFTIYSVPNSKTLLEGVAAQVANLLQDASYLIHKKDQQRRVIPSDIGILVRTGKQGKDVKAQLAQLGIPSVTIDDARVLQSEEARYLLYLLDAIARPDRASINRALLSPFTGFDSDHIPSLNDAAVLELFTSYKKRWQDDGVYTALMDFVADFNVKQVLLSPQSVNGERIITNLFQLVELVHQAENRKGLSMQELLSWLQRGIDGMSAEGDEYTQRMESDDDAVKIVTIHKSKGLEYNIVLAPFLDFVDNKDRNFVSFRDPVSGDYVGAESTQLSPEQLGWYAEQAEQENRRLLYVAITRAVYACYVYRNTYSYYKASTLAMFVNALKDTDDSLIALKSEVPAAPATRYRQVSHLQTLAPAASIHFTLKEENWRKMSYSMLAAKPDQQVPPRSFPLAQEYDNFIFHLLRRGAKTGNFLHFIFENIHFSDDSRWDKWLGEAIRRFVPGQEEIYLPLLREMLNQVLFTNIGGEDEPFTLSDVNWNKRMTELEFDFPVPAFPLNDLHGLSDDQVSILIRNFQGLPENKLEGMMNGKIDLFFEHAGRYYVLDWKSNYLGNDLQDYAPLALARAMNENNYHLQYLIYTVAVKKYLESRLPRFDYATQFGGVIYVFVRGVRAGRDSGIFTHKPSLEKIQALEGIITR